MISLVGSQTQTDDYRTFEEPHEGFRIFDAQHNIIFLIGGNTLGHQIKAAQILLTFLELHHDDVGTRCSTDIRIALSDDTAGGDSGEDTAVSVFVPGGNDGIRILGAQRQVNILSAVFRTIFKPLRWYPGLNRLIPDCQDAAVAVLVQKHRILVINPGIDKTQDHTLPRET